MLKLRKFDRDWKITKLSNFVDEEIKFDSPCEYGSGAYFLGCSLYDGRDYKNYASCTFHILSHGCGDIIVGMAYYKKARGKNIIQPTYKYQLGRMIFWGLPNYFLDWEAYQWVKILKDSRFGFLFPHLSVEKYLLEYNTNDLPPHAFLMASCLYRLPGESPETVRWIVNNVEKYGPTYSIILGYLCHYGGLLDHTPIPSNLFTYDLENRMDEIIKRLCSWSYDWNRYGLWGIWEWETDNIPEEIGQDPDKLFRTLFEECPEDAAYYKILHDHHWGYGDPDARFEEYEEENWDDEDWDDDDY